tara:strand:- start:808 stop:1428 length:621 start_codon:yes stop_codon:yes gene_type:complete
MGDKTKLLSMYKRVAAAHATFKVDGLTQETADWFEAEVARLTDPLPSQRAILATKGNISKSGPIRGGLMMFLYNPESKLTIPYYDRFPIVIPIEVYKKPYPGFLGLNFHYLDYYDRARLLDMLQVLGSKEAIKLNRINYDLLAAVRKYKSFKPCLKRYRMANVMTNMALIPRAMWEIALFMPTEDFRKVKNKASIWRDSKRIYRKT